MNLKLSLFFAMFLSTLSIFPSLREIENYCQAYVEATGTSITVKGWVGKIEYNIGAYPEWKGGQRTVKFNRVIIPWLSPAQWQEVIKNMQLSFPIPSKK